jgi:hypothetical protein
MKALTRSGLLARLERFGNSDGAGIRDQTEVRQSQTVAEITRASATS